MVNQDVSIKPVNGLEPFVMPVVIDGGVMDDVRKLLLLRENGRFLRQF